MRRVVFLLAAFMAPATGAIAGAITADDCRAEFQANLAVQGGYAPEAVVRAGRAGTAEAIYNACLTGVRGDVRARAMGRARVVSGARPQAVGYRREPQAACGVTLVAGNGYACHATRFGG